MFLADKHTDIIPLSLWAIPLKSPLSSWIPWHWAPVITVFQGRKDDVCCWEVLDCCTLKPVLIPPPLVWFQPSIFSTNVVLLIFTPFCWFSFPDGLYKMDQFVRIWKWKFSFLPLNSGVTEKEALQWCVVVSEQAGVVRQHPHKSRLAVLQKPLGEIFMINVVLIVIINETGFLSITEHFLGDVGDPL